ncbi:hypothetical protein MTO96_028586 [Rhipicephalus appendiculatus]
MLPSYKWGPEEPALFNAYQARLRNRGLVPMSSRFPVRFIIPHTVPADAVLPVMFAAEPVKPSWSPISWRSGGGHHEGHVDRVWSLPPNLPALDLSSLAVPMHKKEGAGRLAEGPEAPRRLSAGMLHHTPPQQVRNFLPTLNPNSLGPQFSDSPMRFGLLGRLFIRRHEGHEDVLLPSIPTQGPDQYLNPKLPPMTYPVQPGGPIASTSHESTSSEARGDHYRVLRERPSAALEEKEAATTGNRTEDAWLHALKPDLDIWSSGAGEDWGDGEGQRPLYTALKILRVRH